MNRFESITKPLMWFMALLLVALVAGCSGKGNDPILGGGGGGGGLSPSVTAKAITSYSFGSVAGTINEAAKTISVTLPYSTPLPTVTALVATFTTTGTGVKVGAVAQVSGTTPNNFTSPVLYTVTAADNSTATYTVTVTVALISSKAITSYSLNGVVGVITEPAHTIAVTMPSGTNVTALVATFTTTGTGVTVNGTAQVSGTTPNNFTSPVDYTVTAADSSTAIYTVTVTVAAAPIPLAINLRGAASFGIASRAGMTSSGVTVVNGDIALYPNPSCIDSTGNGGASQSCAVKTYASPTGMTVNGSIYYASDPFDNGGTANSIANDLNIAWTEGQNKTDTFATSSLSGQLAGKILTPGVYHETVLNLAAGGICTFDAAGDANAIFIIKVDSAFTDSGISVNPSQIQLINGAQARNVWFVVGGAATIGTGTTWYGNILAGGTLSISGGSTVTGRLLAGAAGAGAFTMTTTPPETPITISVPQ